MERTQSQAAIASAVERGISRFVLKAAVVVVLLAGLLWLGVSIKDEQNRIAATDRAAAFDESESWRVSQQAAIDAAWAVQMDEWRAAFAAQAAEYQQARDLAIREGRTPPPMPEPIREPKRPEVSASSWPGWQAAR